MSGNLQVLVADDHPLFRGALKQALAGIEREIEIAECGALEEAKDALQDAHDFDLVLLDLAMPGTTGLSGLVSLKSLAPLTPIVVVSASDDPGTIRRSLDLGASGFISKSASMDAIRNSVLAVLEGDVVIPNGVDLSEDEDPEVRETIARLKSLTRQQSRVLAMLSEGLLNKQIAYELDVSEATVKAHVSAILQKLGVESRTRAVIRLAKITSLDEGAKNELLGSH